MRYINTIKEGENVGEIYFCKSKQVLKTKMGKTYYSLVLQDKTGTLDSKIWELNNGIEHFETLDYIYVVGQVTSFQGSLQLNIQRVRKAQEGEYDVADYMPTTKKDVAELYSSLLKYIASVENNYLRELLEMYFVKDKEFVDRFKNHSAAKSVHHGFIGGLLEHTVGVTRLCDFFASCYPIINRDLLITAAIFHDVGKIEELSTFPENDYTEEGQFLGHIYMGTEMIGDGIKKISGFPKLLAIELKHCILAHHGELEFGSPKKPAIIEAMALNFADNTDAKMQTFTELLDSADEKEEWLGYNRFFESNLRRS